MENKEIFFSIIIPAYNCEKYILRTLDSIKQQNFKQCEIIVVNDGSNDGTAECIKSFFAKNKLHHKVITIENGGLANARNVGIANARGKYFINLDSDDFFEKGILNELYRCLLNENVDILMYGFQSYNEDTKQFEDRYEEKFIYFEGIKAGYECAVEKMQKKIWICQGSAAYRKEMILNHEIWNTPGLNQGEDLYFIISALIHAKSVKCLPQIGVNIAYRKDSMMHSKFNESYYETYKIYQKLLKDIENMDFRSSELANYLKADYFNYHAAMIKKIVSSYRITDIKKMKKLFSELPKINVEYEEVKEYLTKTKKIEYQVYSHSILIYICLITIYYKIKK